MTDRASGVVAFLKRAVREPLVHFLAIGAALFVVNGLINGPDEGPVGETVVVYPPDTLVDGSRVIAREEA